MCFFLAISTTVETVFKLPFKYYSTFVIEEKWEFNKTTKGTFVKDTIKELLL